MFKKSQLLKNLFSTLVLVVVLSSCKDKLNKNALETTILIGKWTIVALQVKNQKVDLDSKFAYVLEFDTKNTCSLSAEDNKLSAQIIYTSINSFKVENIAVTDVCCTSENAKKLFAFFEAELHFEKRNNRMVLSKKDGVVILEKKD